MADELQTDPRVADIAIAKTDRARALRAKLAPVVSLLQNELNSKRAMLPSYVGDAADTLLKAIDRWREDERATVA